MRKYTTTKPSGVEWLGDVPAHWEVIKLTRLFDRIGSGTTPSTNSVDYYDGEIPWVTTAELRETVIYDTKQKVTQLALAEHSALKLYKAGAVVIAMYGATIGRLGILGVDATLNQACCVFENPIGVDSKFFYYWLWAERPTLISLSTGGGQPNLSQDLLKQLKMPVPPLDEQRVIAAFLDERTAHLDSLIRRKEDLLKLLTEQRAALITRAVTRGLDVVAPLRDSGVPWLGQVPAHWEVKRLKFGLAAINPVGSNLPLPEDALVSFVPMTAVGEYGGLDLEMEKPLDEIGSGYTYFADNDVVVAKITPCFENGKGALATGLTNGVGFGTTELHVLRHNAEMDSQFLFLLTISEPFRKLGEGEMIGAGGQKRVPEEFIKNLMAPFPPIDEQREIAAAINQINERSDKMTDITNREIAKLREYRAALITAAVTGRIDVRAEVASTPEPALVDAL
ncbi:restriction endonuclease subunit S [Hymenobacter sediminis]|uniref:restriction endonuclease subunit S n=1 Tax=Hymenobacter sediminis TaxID=2218621 RepID=UPI000DA658C4|nr:restriction endonuclease subunit S [Hymenobacter sediminis]RPD49864.1 restriction endonuclease subunit S [Hymenobacter sediminis]